MVRRPVAVLVAAAALAGACGGGGDDPTPGLDAAVTTTAPVEAPTTTPTPSGAPPPTTAAGPPVGTAAPPSGDGGPVTTVGGGGGPAVGKLPVGLLAPALLQPGHGNRIVLELRAQSGASPTSATIDHVVQVLQAASGKAVAVDGPDPIGGGGRAWTAGQLADAADAAAEAGQGGQQIVLRILFLRGSFEGDESVLGIAVRGDVAAVFSDQVDAAAGLLVAPSVVEDAVAVHEVGHLMGLVDLVLGSGRGDPDHPGHSRNQDSVMYWAVESDVISQLLDGGIPNTFDADDRAELAQIRSG